MKKIISFFLSLTVVFSLSVPAFAAENTTSTSTSGIIGTIIFQETGPTNSTSRSNDIAEVTVSYVYNEDQSYTIYQYNDGTLIEEHKTTPGSGVVDHKYYNSDGTFTAEREVVNEDLANGIIPFAANTSTRPLGYMHYRNPWTQELFSINCYVEDEAHVNEPYTFYKGTAKTLGEWTATLLTNWIVPPSIISLLITDALTNILKGPTTGLISAVITKTVYCTYYNQELHGDPTQPAGRGKHAVLTGTYCYLDIATNKIKTEGYTVRDWGNSSMGRQMMYKVFGIDEAPTSWTNIDLR